MYKIIFNQMPNFTVDRAPGANKLTAKEQIDEAIIWCISAFWCGNKRHVNYVESRAHLFVYSLTLLFISQLLTTENLTNFLITHASMSSAHIYILFIIIVVVAVAVHAADKRLMFRYDSIVFFASFTVPRTLL
jgi:hypothetical protein